jgi:hypothetical protein
MKNSLQLLLVKSFRLLPPPFFNIFLVLIALCCAKQQLYAQNPADFLTAPTYIGGYHIKCNGQSTGSITANPSFGTPPYTYLWNTSETTAQIANKPAGVYIVTATDSLNVSYSDTLTLTQPNNLSYQSTLSNYYGYNIEKHGHNNGSIQLAGNGGTPPYTYLWNNNDNNASRTDLTAGYYSFIITDANQCSTNGNITLTEPYPVQFNFTNVQSTQCFDGADGAATLNISGGLGDFSVVWSNGSFSLSPNDLPAGYNEVRIMERGRAIIDTGIIINSPAKLEIDITISQYANGYNVSCVDCYNGSITTAVTGGTAPYTYLWKDDNNSSTADLSNLNEGQYGVTVTDANGCIIEDGTRLRMPIAKDWSRQGNANIDPAEFIGSTDTSAVVFKTNSQEAMRLMGNGNVELAGDLRIANLASNTEGLLGYEQSGTVRAFTHSQITEALYRSLPCPTSNTDGSAVSAPNWNSISWGQGYFNGLNTCGKVGINFPSGVLPMAELEVRGSSLIRNNLTVENDFNLWGNAHITGNHIVDGKLGIGTANPTQKLEINHNDPTGGILINKVSSDASKKSEIKFNKNGGQVAVIGCDIDNNGKNTFFIWQNNSLPTPFIINAIGKVGIGGVYPPETTTAPYKLYVEGGIATREIKVTTVNPFPDYVFNESYPLISIQELDLFVKKHKHLPGIASAKEVDQNDGFELGEMQRKMLEKLEEQTLYIIALQQQIDELKKLLPSPKN